MVDVGPVEELRSGVVAHLVGQRDADEVRPVPLLRDHRGVGVGVGGDTVHVVEVEPAHVAEGFRAPFGGAAGVVVARIVGLREFDGLVDDRTGDFAEGAVGEIAATGLGVEELVFTGWFVGVIGERRLGVVGPALQGQVVALASSGSMIRNTTASSVV